MLRGGREAPEEDDESQAFLGRWEGLLCTKRCSAAERGTAEQVAGRYEGEEERVFQVKRTARAKARNRSF